MTEHFRFHNLYGKIGKWPESTAFILCFREQRGRRKGSVKKRDVLFPANMKDGTILLVFQTSTARQLCKVQLNECCGQNMKGLNTTRSQNPFRCCQNVGKHFFFFERERENSIFHIKPQRFTTMLLPLSAGLCYIDIIHPYLLYQFSHIWENTNLNTYFMFRLHEFIIYPKDIVFFGL